MQQESFRDEFLSTFQPDLSRPIVIAVSGGADSLCLLHLLLDSGLKLIPAHIDHQIRKVSSEQAAQLQSLIGSWGLECEMGKIDVPEAARKAKMSIEEAARNCRYEFLFEVAKKHQAQAVLTAHHLDDQVETVLMHFLRGSGVNGLTGMSQKDLLAHFSKTIPIWRPLLAFDKEKILAYCQANQIQAIEDESNQDRRYYRNKLRLDLIPEIEKVQPDFKKIVARNADVIRLDRDVLTRVAEQAYQDCLMEEDSGQALVFDRDKWLKLEEGLQYRILMQAAGLLLPELRDLGFEVLNRAKANIEAKKASSDFKSGLKIFCLEDTFIIAQRSYQLPLKDYPQIKSDTVYKLTQKKPVQLLHDWEIKAEIVDRKVYERAPKKIKEHPDHAWLNPADLEWPLTVRSAMEGERWSPLGMVLQRQKLSDFFINQKIPRRARESWPIVSVAGSILWVAGLRIAQAWRLTGQEVEVLHLQLIPPHD